MLRPIRTKLRAQNWASTRMAYGQNPFVMGRPALQGRTDMAEPMQILQWRSSLGLKGLNFVPMGSWGDAPGWYCAGALPLKTSLI